MNLSFILVFCIALTTRFGGHYNVDVDESNPFHDATVGEWVEYESRGKDYTAQVIMTVVKIEGPIVHINEKVFFDGESKPSEESRQVDRSKPLSPFFQLRTFKLVGQPVTPTSQRKEKLNIAGQEIETTRQEFVLKSPFGSTQKVLWTSKSIPLDGVVKSTSKGSLSSSVTELVRYGKSAAEKTDARAPQTGESFTNQVGGKMLKVKASAFSMGQMNRFQFMGEVTKATTKEAKLELLTQKPPYRHVVLEKDYWLGEKEVTVGQFRKFVKATGYQTSAEASGEGGTGRLASGDFTKRPKFNWKSVGFEIDDSHPVVNVTYRDAMEFCKWMSKMEKVKYRLPSEEEWEFACRGGAKTFFASGNTVGDLKGYANVADASLKSEEQDLPWAADFDDGFAFLAPAGSFKPNALGFYDMHGNALEICGTKFAMYSPLWDGTDATRDALKTDSSFVVRGGNWFNSPALAGCPSRSGVEPNVAMSLIGFRIVAEASPK